MTPNEYLKKPYGRVVFPEEDGTFRAEIIEFPGCIAVGDSASEALSRLDAVAESWLKSTIDRGQRVPEPFLSGVALRFIENQSRAFIDGKRRCARRCRP